MSGFRSALYGSSDRLAARRNPKQVEWARSFAALLEELRKYIMQYHTTGLVWNPKVCAAGLFALHLELTAFLTGR